MSRIPLLLLILLTLPAADAWAQGWIEPFPGRPNPAIVKLRTDVMVRVTGRIAVVEVEELFRNDGTGLGEGEYIYPLPGEAIFDNFSLFQGDLELRGETMDANRARSIYEEIVRRRKDPALIELLGHGALRARVFPIAAGETRKIILRYTQVLERAGDAVTFRYAGSSAAHGVRPVASDVGQRVYPPLPVPTSFEMTIEDGDAFRDPFSPTHRVLVERTNGTLRVRPDGPMRGRFALFLPLASTEVGMTLATHRPAGREDGYFMLTLSPPDATAETVARDLTVVLDVSGSMSGRKMSQARAALRQLLGSLNREDRFRLIAFSNRARPFADGWRRADNNNLNDARMWIDDLRADGGTNIEDALSEAFAEPGHPERLHIVLFVTDGLPSVGNQDPQALARIAAAGPDGARVFAFGVGYDVNTVLLDQLTAEGRGGTHYVEPDEDVETAIATLGVKISHPVLTDLRIGDTPVSLDEIYPVTLPDLFAGEELIVMGRYAARGTDARGSIQVTGRRAGARQRFATDVVFPVRENGNAFIPRLWASRKLGHLTRTIRLEGRTDALVEEIRATALRYGLLSEYTSYLVLEPGETVAGQPVPRSRADMPAPVSGQLAVQAAEQARRQREVRSEADLDLLSGDEHNASPDRRRIGGRWFTQQDGRWTDLRPRAGRPVVAVKPYSEAYFALLRAAPELEAFFRLERILVVGADISLELTDSGAERMPEAEVIRLVESFRGS